MKYNVIIVGSGIRAIENSGIVMPMLKQLDIVLQFVKTRFLLISVVMC